MRRGEVLGLRWADVDFDTACLSVTRSLVSVGYELYETRGKSRTARRCINLDPATIDVLHRWRDQRAGEDPEFDAGDAEGRVLQPARRHADPSTSPVGHVQASRRAIRTPTHPLPRPPPHPRHPALEGRRPDQSRQRTPRALHPRIHDGHLPARHPRHAARSSAHIRGHPRSQTTSTGFYPVEVPVEALQTRRGPAPGGASDQHFVGGGGRI